MKNNLPDDETLVDKNGNCEVPTESGNSADDRCAIIPGQIAHLLEKGYRLGGGFQGTTGLAANL